MPVVGRVSYCPAILLQLVVGQKERLEKVGVSLVDTVGLGGSSKDVENLALMDGTEEILKFLVLLGIDRFIF